MKEQRVVLKDGTVDVRFEEDPEEVGEGEDANEESGEIKALEAHNKAQSGGQ
jgi:hypothetical protein